MVVFALTLLPGRVRIMPPGAVVLMTLVLITPMVGVWFAEAKQRWLRIEAVVTTPIRHRIDLNSNVCLETNARSPGRSGSNVPKSYSRF